MRRRTGSLPLKLVVYDDKSQIGTAAEHVERLIVDDQVELLIGPYSSALTRAAVPIAERHRKLLWNHGGASDLIQRSGLGVVVNILSPASQYFTGILAMMAAYDPSIQRVALLYGSKGTFPRDVVAGAEGYAHRHGFQVIFKAPYPSTADLSLLGAKLSACQPEVILGAGRTEVDVAVARWLKAQRVGARMVGLVATPIQAFKDALGEDVDGFVGPSQWEPQVNVRPDIGPSPQEFADRFRARFQAEPDYLAAQAYAAGLIAGICVQEAGTLRDEAVREVVGGLDVKTLYGNFRLHAQTGEQVGHQLLIVQWQGGEKRIVWPQALAEAGPEVPYNCE